MRHLIRCAAVDVGSLRRVAMVAATPRGPAATHRHHVVLAVGGIALLIALNIAVYLAPIDYEALTSYAYVGAFLVCLLANALVAVPIPYIPIIAHIGATADSAAIVVALAALGSVLGESVAFLIGRAEEGLISERPIYRRLHRLAERKWLSGLLLFALAVPLNPLFDVAGLAAGAVGMRYRVFFVAVFAGRLVRLALIVWLGVLIGL
ncbi:MAG TPA: VTT domain-containing protein [Candidatus Limnocylindria bacterium]|nr:VTT domain-containing protein [Candidatus Limnocylindria bacterium]